MSDSEVRGLGFGFFGLMSGTPPQVFRNVRAQKIATPIRLRILDPKVVSHGMNPGLLFNPTLCLQPPPPPPPPPKKKKRENKNEDALP